MMNRILFLKVWSVAVGSMDALTGFALVLAPTAVLRLLHINAPSPDALAFLSWIGIFVLGVGLSYGLALTTRGRGEAVWIFTSGVRLLVAIYLTKKILDGAMAATWAQVALADAAVAIVQITILRMGWWREVKR